MQSKKETSEKENQKLVDSYDYLANAAMESYNEVYHYEPPKVPVKKK